MQPYLDGLLDRSGARGTRSTTGEMFSYGRDIRLTASRASLLGNRCVRPTLIRGSEGSEKARQRPFGIIVFAGQDVDAPFTEDRFLHRICVRHEHERLG